MSASALIDTGAILALLDRSDRWHAGCVRAFRQLRLPLLTSQAVLTELFHLVGDSRTEMEAAWKFVRSGAVVLGAIEDNELPYLRTLMQRYWDRPMDFADATLVYLAKRESALRDSHGGSRRLHHLPHRWQTAVSPAAGREALTAFSATFLRRRTSLVRGSPANTLAKLSIVSYVFPAPRSPQRRATL